MQTQMLLQATKLLINSKAQAQYDSLVQFNPIHDFKDNDNGRSSTSDQHQHQQQAEDVKDAEKHVGVAEKHVGVAEKTRRRKKRHRRKTRKKRHRRKTRKKRHRRTRPKMEEGVPYVSLDKSKTFDGFFKKYSPLDSNRSPLIPSLINTINTFA